VLIEALAIGRFDGMHLGHFELFKRLGERGAILLIDTKKSNLTPPDTLSRYTDILVLAYELDRLKDLSAEEFVAMLKADFPALKKIVVGEDFRFAKDRSGDTNKLKALFDGLTVVVPELKIDGIGVHSRFIRSLILDGDLLTAGKFLGRFYEVCGAVVKGQGIGAQKLVPTVNIAVKGNILPKEGVYASFCEIGGRELASVTFVGHRVSTDGNFAVESHILGDERFELSENIFVKFIKKIRDNRYFETIDELKKAIHSDIASAKQIISGL